MEKPVVFLDSNFFNDVFGRGSAFNKNLGISFLNNLIKNNEVRITDRIDVESTSDLSFAKDAAVREWLNANNITPMPTKVGAGVDAGTEPVIDSGERSIIEAIKNPELAGREVHVISNDTEFYSSTGEGSAYVDKVIHLQDLAKQFLRDGSFPITDYNTMAENNATLNKGDPNVTPWLTKPQQFNETPFAQANGHLADENGIVTDTKTGTQYNLSDVFKNMITDESGGSGSLADVASYIGTDVASVEAALLRGTVNVAGGVLAGLGIAAIAADILHTSQTARAQVDSGNIAGAAASVESLAARVGLGITGAEAGFATGVAWAEEAAAVGLIAASGPLDIVAGLLLAAAAGIAGVVDGNALVKALNGAIDALIHGMKSLVDGWGSGDGSSGDGSGADGSGGNGSGSGAGAFPSGGATIPGSETPEIHSGFDGSMTDPIVLGLNGSSVELTSLANSQAYFDLHGTGFAVHTGWVGANTGLLVNSATPTSINNLFGNSSTDGFTALKAIDSDGNNIINSNDPGFSQLYAWADANGNGVADAGEVKSLDSLGITAINLENTPLNQDAGGNIIAQIATFTYSDGSTGQVAEAFFNNSQMDSEFTGSYTLNPSVLILPNLRGYGTLPPLYIAMSLDPSLLNLVKDLTNEDASDTADFAAEVTAILYKWAGAENIDPTSRGSYFDAQKLAVLEAFNGEQFISTFGGISSPDPISTHEGETLANSWNTLLSAMEARLLVQGPLATAFPNVHFDYDTDSLIGSIDSTAIAEATPTGGFQAAQYWHNMTSITEMIANDLGISSNQVLNTLQTAFGQTNAAYSWESTQGDNFVFAAGDGNVIIDESNKTSGILTIADANANAGNITLQASDNGDLTVILSSGDKITFRNDLSFADGASSTYGDFSKITQINFVSGGAPLILNNYNWAGLPINQQLTFTWNDTNTNIAGSRFGNNLFNFGPGDDTVTASTPTAKNTTNTFVFHKGDGHDVVNLNGSAGVLQLAPDIAVSDVTPTSNANGDLIISLNTGDSITFLNDLSFADGISDQHGYASKVSQVEFANGVIWDKNRILTSGNGDYYIAGSYTDDLYIHNQGDGVDTIFDDGFGGNDTLQFTGADLTSANAILTRSDSDVDTITVGFSEDAVWLNKRYANDNIEIAKQLFYTMNV